jgi:hypothetical protein
MGGARGGRTSGVQVRISPGLSLFPRSPEDERRVVSRIERSLRAAGGSWHATVTPSAALEHFWVVRIARSGNGIPSRSVVFDERSPEPDAQLLRVVAEMEAAPKGPAPAPPSRPRPGRR